MKRKVVLSIATICVIILSFMCFASYAVEEETSTEKNMLISTLDEKLDSSSDTDIAESVVANSETIGDQYLMANSVSVPSGIYDGNMYIIGKEVTFSGANVKGNIYVIAGNLSFDASTVSGSLYAMAGKMEGKNEFNAIDVYVMAQILKMDATTSINRSFKAMGSDVYLNGNYAYDVNLLVGDSNGDYSNLDFSKLDDVTSTTKKIEGKLELGNELTIGRDFNYSAKEEATIPSTASIGNVNYSVLTEDSSVEFEKEKSKLISMTSLIKLVIRLINTAFMTIAVAWTCKRFRRLNQYHSGIGLFFKSILKGSLGSLLFLIGVVLLVVLTCFACFFVGLVGVTSYAFALIFALPIAANMIAINILGIKEEADEGIGYKVALLGVALVVAVIIWLVNWIPVAGGIVTLLFALMGIGGFIDFIFGNTKKLQTNYQDKMSKKFKIAKITEDNKAAQTEEPKLDSSDPYGNTSIMMDEPASQEGEVEDKVSTTKSDVDEVISAVDESAKEATTTNEDASKEVKENDVKSDDDTSKE